MTLPDWFVALESAVQGFVLYLLLVNIITFLTFGIDKLFATQQSRRISEKTLFIMTALGGSIGALFAMKFFRHKRRKTAFFSVIVLFFFLHILIGYLLVPEFL